MKKNFFQEHPYCIFCGGAVAATTKEHCPPKALFQHKQWPEGFEFPACVPCNNGTSDDDVLVALIGRIDPFSQQGNDDGRSFGLMRNVHNQHPGLLEKMFETSATEARRSARELGLRPPPGKTYQEMGITNVTPRMEEAVKTLAKKLSKAIYYRETGEIFPKTGELQFHWFTNEVVFRHGSSPALDAVNFKAETPKITRAGKDLSNQFDYRYSMSPERDIAFLQAIFGRAFGFVTVASPVEGLLSNIMERVREKTGNVNGPFSFI